MILRQVLNKAIAELRQAKIDSPILDAELLLKYTTGFSKEKILTHPEIKLTRAEVRRFLSLTRRRAKHEPVAYITGHKEFYGLDFLVNKNVLIPRPETETLIEAVVDCLHPHPNPPPSRGRDEISNPLSGGRKIPSLDGRGLGRVAIIDVGTGSGSIAVTLAKLFPKAKVFATDVSDSTLKVARKNAKLHRVKIKFAKSDLLSTPTPTLPHQGGGKSPPLMGGVWGGWREGKTIIITANLPYLPTREWCSTAPEIKKFEPKSSLDGGKDGLKCYRKLLKQLTYVIPNAVKNLPRMRGKATHSCEFLRLPPPVSRLMGTRDDNIDIHLFLEFDPEQTKTLKKSVLKYFPKAKIEIKKDLAGRNRVAVIKFTI